MRTLAGRTLLRAAFRQQSGARSLVSTTLPLLERKVIKVPTMGDSITEGTIVEWTAKVGQAVKADDVVALVETDKVTVEIKAEMDGVLTKQFGAVDETVEVGAQLYEIDTEAEASYVASDEPAAAAAASPSPAKEETKQQSAAPTPPPQKKEEAHHRTPSIKFLGKDGWAQLKAGSGHQSPVTEQIHPLYGRLPFTQEEVDALVFGGASLEPQNVPTVYFLKEF